MAADYPGETADPLGDDRVALVRHRRGALLTAPERLLHLAHFRAREIADLESEPLERGGKKRKRGEERCMSIALEDLGRARRRLQAERLTGNSLHPGRGRRVRPDRAGELSDAHTLQSGFDPFAIPRKLEGPAGELEPERRRLCVDSVRTPDRERETMLFRSGDDRV